MSKPEINLVHYVNDVEYSHFDTDPDGDPTRAGDGIYFKLPGEDSWHGPEEYESDAEEEARRSLHYHEIDMLTTELENQGYNLVRQDDSVILFMTKAKERWFQIGIVSGDDVVTYGERHKALHVNQLGKIEFDNGQEVFGSLHRAVRQASEAIAAELGFQHGVVPRTVYDENAVTAMLVYEAIREFRDNGKELESSMTRWWKSTGENELRFQSLAMAELIDGVYSRFTNYELDSVLFDEEFVPTMLLAFDYTEANEQKVPTLSGGIDGGVEYAKRVFEIPSAEPRI